MPLTALPQRCTSLLKQCARDVKVLAHALAPHLNHVRNVVVVVQSIPTREYFPFLHRARAVKEKEPLLNTHVVHAAGLAVNIVPVRSRCAFLQVSTMVNAFASKVAVHLGTMVALLATYLWNAK